MCIGNRAYVAASFQSYEPLNYIQLALVYLCYYPMANHYLIERQYNLQLGEASQHIHHV